MDRATRDAGGEYVGLLLMADEATAVRRFHDRPDDPSAPWLDEVREIVAGLGGDDALLTYRQSLLDLAAARGDRVITAVDGQVEQTYADVLAALGR